MTDAKAFIPPKIESFIFTAVLAVVSPPTLRSDDSRLMNPSFGFLPFR